MIYTAMKYWDIEKHEVHSLNSLFSLDIHVEFKTDETPLAPLVLQMFMSNLGVL